MTDTRLKVAMDGRSLSGQALRGWDRYTIELAAELLKGGIDLTLVHRAGEPINDACLRRLNCKTLAIESCRGLQWEQISLPQALHRGGYHIYHAPAEHAVPFFSPCPVVLTIHSVTWHSYAQLVKSGQLSGKASDYVGSQPNWKDRMYWRTQVARADHILTPSEFSKNEIVRYLRIPAAKVTATPLGVPVEFLAAAHHTTILADSNIKRPYLLYVGGYEKHKNVTGLLKVFALVRKEYPALSLVLVGTKDVPPELVAHSQTLSLHVGQDVFFLTNLRNELIDLYDNADLFVTLSWRESFCLPALEAMARGLRVVGSKWGALPEVVGDLGSLIDPRDERLAAATILDMIRRPAKHDLQNSLRARSRQFSWYHTAKAAHAVYSRLAG